VLQGQKQRFNFQGKQKIKCNTGWVDENYSELIQDLLLSQVVLLDNKPAIVKSQSFDIKTNLKDKNINYEIEFEYNRKERRYYFNGRDVLAHLLANMNKQSTFVYEEAPF